MGLEAPCRPQSTSAAQKVVLPRTISPAQPFIPAQSFRSRADIPSTCARCWQNTPRSHRAAILPRVDCAATSARVCKLGQAFARSLYPFARLKHAKLGNDISCSANIPIARPKLLLGHLWLLSGQLASGHFEPSDYHHLARPKPRMRSVSLRA